MRTILLSVAFTLMACGSEPVRQPPLGTIDQETGLLFNGREWERAWWSKDFDAAKTAGCHLEDSCGIFPPFYVSAEYCGEPRRVCPGERRR